MRSYRIVAGLPDHNVALLARVTVNQCAALLLTGAI